MNTKRLIPAMLLAMALVIFWQVGVQFLYKQMGWALPGEQPLSSTTQPSAEQTASTTSTTQSIASTSSTASTSQATGQGIRAMAASMTTTALLGSEQEKDPNYVLAVRTTSRGAGIESVTLNQFHQTVKGKQLYAFQQPYPTSPDSSPLATRRAGVKSESVPLSAVDWVLESSSPGSATYAIELADDSGPLVRLRKTYVVRTRSETKDTSQGYEVGVKLSFENLRDQAVAVSTEFNGTSIPPIEVYNGLDRQIVGAYDEGGYATLHAHAVENFTKEQPSINITRSEKNNLPLVWAGTVGVYFDAIVRPLPIAQGSKTPTYIKQVEARGTSFEHAHQHDVVTTFATTDLKLDPKQTLELPLEVFFGPKQRSLLNSDYYTAPLIGYNHTLVLGGSCAWCTFQWLVDLLVKLLVGLHWLFGGFAGHGDWGLAIIGLVCIVRLILHPVTKKSQVNMMAMGKMGPEMEKLKKKYGDDKEGLAKAQMEVYKTMGFTPVWGCLPMFLQMPIFIALFAALNSTFELRHSPFLWFGRVHLTWIGDLSQPDRLFYFPNHPLNLGFFTLDSINLLPLLVAVVSFFSTKYTPKPPATTPEQVQQQKMMQWMTLILPLLFYQMPSGLNIYYLTSTTIGIIEGKIIRDHIKQREEAEKAGRVIIDAAPSRRRRTSGNNDPEKPKSGLAA